MDSPRIAPTRSTGRVVIPLLLLAAIILTLWPVCTAQFTQWDDIGAIATERTFLPPTWHSLAVWWSRPILFMWIPMSYTTWGFLALIAKEPAAGGWTLNPCPFHCFNLLLHVLSAVVAWRILVLLVKKPWAAAAGAALWALHPVQVETVAWATGLRDVLCGFFTLVALWQYLLAIRGRRWRFTAATVCYALALLSKPSAISTPLLAAVLEWATAFSLRGGFIIRTGPGPSPSPLQGESRGEGPAALHGRESHGFPAQADPHPGPPPERGREQGPAARRPNEDRSITGSFLRLGLWLAMAVPIALIARRAQPVYRVSEYVPVWHRPLVALDAIAFYVGKIVFPVRLCIDYGRSPIKIFDCRQAYWTWLIPVAIAGVLAIFGRRRPIVLAGAAIFVLGLLPVLGLASFDFQSYSTVADHYLYLPMLGVALMAAAILASPAVMRHARIAAAGAMIVLGVLAFQSFRQTWVWQDSDTLFAHSLAVDPLGPAVNDWLAHAALDAGQPKRAAKYADASIRGNPKRSHGYILLAEAYRQEGKEAPALSAARRAYAIEPADPAVVMGLAVVLDDNGQNAESTELFHKAIALDPTMPTTHLNFAIHLANTGQATAARAELRKAAGLAPDDPALLVHVGDELADMGGSADARAEYESALRVQPGYGPALDGLLALPKNAGKR
ncbi:MAG TPA: tetratricopeptide repeat protein [Tepidisphaeraceae bacterium]|jgi:cytochrome c-type biogenesis protein CcmH/NrfG|nr:tetratricopeptide repeat protein [Tepidisphaeraceae bacterium]